MQFKHVQQNLSCISSMKSDFGLSYIFSPVVWSLEAADTCNALRVDDGVAFVYSV